MTKKLTLIVAAAAVLMFMVTVSASAMRAAAEPYGWDLQLRNARTTASAKNSADMTYKAFATWAGLKHRTVTIEDTSTATPTTYTGVSLKTLVGYFDDKDRTTFNVALAVKGYNVVILGMDGYAATFASADIAALGAKVILADKANGLPLTVPAAGLDRNGLPSWKPSWPLKVVSLDPSVTGKMKPGGVVRLSIVPAVAPAATGAAPF